MQPDTRDAGYLFDMLRFSREAIEIAADTGAQVRSRDRGLERSISLIGGRLLEIVETHLPQLIQQLVDLVPPVPES